MRLKVLTLVGVILALLLVSIVPTVVEAEIPSLPATPTTLPSVTYYYGSTHYTITDSEWRAFVSAVYDNTSYVSYNWTGNATQYLILFDLGYSAVNPYGLDIVLAMQHIGFPSVKNLTIAFNKTRSLPSQLSGYSNIAALNAGAYPGFSWSVPKIKPMSTVYIEVGVIAGIVAATFALYFVFNRKR